MQNAKVQLDQSDALLATRSKKQPTKMRVKTVEVLFRQNLSLSLHCRQMWKLKILLVVRPYFPSKLQKVWRVNYLSYGKECIDTDDQELQ